MDWLEDFIETSRSDLINTVASARWSGSDKIDH